MCVFIQIVYVLCVYTAKIVGAGNQESYIQYVCVCVYYTGLYIPVGT